MKWISVKDRLPEDEDLIVLATDGIGLHLGSSNVYKIIGHDNCAYWCRVVDVTYWMPLPIPPEVE